MTGRSRAAFAVALLLLLLPADARGQAATAAASTFELTVANIMRGPEHVGSAPSRIRWADNGSSVYFRWKPGGEPWQAESDLYRVDARGGPPQRLTEAAADSLGPLLADGDISRDERWRVVSHEGDLHLVDRRSLAISRLTDTRAMERNPVFARDGRAIFYIRDEAQGGISNVYRVDRDGGAMVQLTDLRPGPAPRDTSPAPQRGFLEEQQLELFEHIRRETEERERRERRREEREERRPAVEYLAQGERVSSIAVNPSGRSAVIIIGKPARDSRATMVPDYVTASGYTEPLEVRTKVGDVQSESRAAWLDLATGAMRPLDLSPGVASANVGGRADVPTGPTGPTGEDPPADTTGGETGGGDRASAPSTPALAAASFLGWNDDGTLGLIASVSFEYRDQWLHALDAGTGELRLLAHDHDPAWIGGPCDPWLDGSCAGWLPDGRAAYFISERDGFSHLYTVPASGGAARQLTSGEWEVYSARISPDERRFHLHTTEETPFQLHFYRANLDGGARTRVTREVGRHDVSPSPDGRRLAVVHSRANHPGELHIMEDRPGADMRPVTMTPTAEWRSFPWVHPEIVRFEARDGVSVPARVYRPSDLGATPNGAAVIFVHGAGYLHNVHDWWSSYYREYMFHHLLASRGYVVLDIDYRGSAGYGRDWRTAIYRHMGGKDLTDHVDGARYLADHEGVDPGRIGIYGGSYGGFITLMALFTEAEHFAAGAALRSVTDWAHYNHPYTNRILNTPYEDDEAFRRSSPIYFAEGLQDPLLIAHGMVDVNVQFQDVVRLAQRLIELGKTDWEMAVYPVEDHGFVEPTSWTDEYRRILELFETHLNGGGHQAGDDR